MKSFVLALIAALTFSACGSGEKKAPEATTTESAPLQAAASEKALELIGSKGCTACHALDKKLIGPAYIDVSKKYEASADIIDSLSHKVINGGVGVWGDVPMTANKTVTPEEAKEMVTYILSLKNQ